MHLFFPLFFPCSKRVPFQIEELGLAVFLFIMGGFEIVYSAWYLPGRVFHISYKIRVFVLFVFLCVCLNIDEGLLGLIFFF